MTPPELAARVAASTVNERGLAMATIGLVGRLVGQDVAHSADLEWTDEHPASRYGLGVVLLRAGPGSLLRDGRVVDGASFRAWRDLFGHRIVTTRGECGRIAGALGVPADEPGIVLQG